MSGVKDRGKPSHFLPPPPGKLGEGRGGK